MKYLFEVSEKETAQLFDHLTEEIIKADMFELNIWNAIYGPFKHANIYFDQETTIQVLNEIESNIGFSDFFFFQVKNVFQELREQTSSQTKINFS